MNKVQILGTMTREEALLRDKGDWKNTVDIIYDDYESRLCTNCKHYDYIMPQNNPHDQYNFWGCIEIPNIGQTYVGFGCNKFKRN